MIALLIQLGTNLNQIILEIKRLSLYVMSKFAK